MRRVIVLAGTALVSTLVACSTPPASPTSPPLGPRRPVELVSVALDGRAGLNGGSNPTISADGRFVAFRSSSPELVQVDANFHYDVFVRDLTTRTTELVSIDSDGLQGPSASSEPRISADGRVVVFTTENALVAEDENGTTDVYVHDRDTQETSWVSERTADNAGGEEFWEPTLSGDGSVVVFRTAVPLDPTDDNGHRDVYAHDRTTGTTTLVSRGMGGVLGDDRSVNPSVSADGRYVAFSSWATNLVADDENDVVDVFVHDRVTATTTRESVGDGGIEGSGVAPVLSADGGIVAFISGAPNLVDGDTNYQADVFVRDRIAGTTERVSVATDGTQADNRSGSISLDDGGRYVAFSSRASNLDVGDTNRDDDVFVHDRTTGRTTRITLTGSGHQLYGFSLAPAMSASGARVAFYSNAENVTGGDGNGDPDVFVTDWPI